MSLTYRVRSDIAPGAIDNALLAIYNSAGSGKIVTVKEIAVNYQGAYPDAGNLGLESLNLISAHSGGSALSADKMDSDTPDLSSLIELRTEATVTVGATIKRIGSVPNFVTSLANVFGAGQGSVRSRLNLGEFFGNNFSGTLQGIILREGEGFCHQVPEGYRPISSYYKGLVIFRVIGVGTYSCEFDYNPCGDGYSGFSMFNRTGSGGVVEILRFDVYEAGDTTPPIFTVFPIKGICRFVTGNDLTSIKMDSTNPDVPASIVLKSDCGIDIGSSQVMPGGERQLFASMELRYFCYRFGQGPRLINYMMPPVGVNRLQFAVAGRWVNKIFDGSYVMREGEGMAITLCTSELYSSYANVAYNSSYLNYFTTVRFTIEDAPAPVPTGGGGCAGLRRR